MEANKNILPVGHVLHSPNSAYRIEGVLGMGGFGITYLATSAIKVGNISVRAKFAIKEHFISSDCEREVGTSRVVYSNPAKERVENSRKDFISEAKRLHKVGINHGYIVKINEVFEANNTAYYVMEFLDGRTLRSMVRLRGGISEKETLSIMRPIIDAVQYLHQNRVTHLDIKPDNIMITRDDNGELRPVLIDFGLSKHYDKDGRPTSTINTIACSDGYAPIEQYAGITSFSPTADIYAIGATLWFCLTGEDPKKSTDLSEGELAKSLPASVSTEMKQIIEDSCTLNRFYRKLSLDSVGVPNVEEESEREQNVTGKTQVLKDKNHFDKCVLFKIGQKATKSIWGIAVLYLLCIIGLEGSGVWYYCGVAGFLKQLSTITVFLLSVYGLVRTKDFIKSKRMRYYWAFSVALALSSISWIYYFHIGDLIIGFIVYIFIVICYECITSFFPRCTQLGFILSLVLSGFYFLLT